MILVLSIITLAFVAVDTLFDVTDETSRLFFIIDTLICTVFLVDVVYRGIIRPDRRAYWRWGWIDLISSIPAVAFLRWGRLIRIVRIVRVLRAFRSTRAIIGHLFQDPARGSVFTVALATFTLVMFGSVAILNVEGEVPGATIQSASDALWWAFVTVTTVGYGDYYPVTDIGRVVAALLMAAGVGLFGTLTAYLANAWLSQQRSSVEADDLDAADPTNPSHEVGAQLREIQERLERIEQAQRYRS